MATFLTIREDMKNKIEQTCSEITIEQLIKVRQAFQQRLQQQEDKYFEHLLN